MLDTLEFSEYWKNRIERDLTSFGDPGATVAVTGSGRRLRAAWTMRGKDHEAVFSTSRDRGVRVNIGSRHLEYGAFVAGTDMADLRYVARMILQASKPQLFVPTRAEHANEPDAKTGPALELLKALLDQENHDATRVIMVTGEAGAGKTRVLQELVRRRADAYLRGQSTKLLLYVNAQGRALARLNEALATELQDLKVGLTYHSVAVLARLGILIPVIDGFDELLGVSGYDDAFSSLADFLEQLEGEGQLLASARSVYYEDEFLSRAGSLSTSGDQAWSHDAVRVHKWSDEDREDYLNQWVRSEGLSDEESTKLRERLQAVFDDRNAALAEKPLFFARMVGILRNKPEFSAGDDPFRALVYEYLDRERTDKLLDKQSRSLLSEQQFETLMCELAQEMWNQETRELDHRSVREVAEYVVESEGLSDTAKQVVISRMRTFAFLARRGRLCGVTASDILRTRVVLLLFLGQIHRIPVRLGGHGRADCSQSVRAAGGRRRKSRGGTERIPPRAVARTTPGTAGPSRRSGCDGVAQKHTGPGERGPSRDGIVPRVRLLHRGRARGRRLQSAVSHSSRQQLEWCDPYAMLVDRCHRTANRPCIDAIHRLRGATITAVRTESRDILDTPGVEGACSFGRNGHPRCAGRPDLRPVAHCRNAEGLRNAAPRGSTADNTSSTVRLRRSAGAVDEGLPPGEPNLQGRSQLEGNIRAPELEQNRTATGRT